MSFYRAHSGIALDEYPSRDTALALVAALTDPQTVDLKEAARRCGLDYFTVSYTADLCWRVYGYPELEPGNFARWVAEKSMNDRPTNLGPQAAPPVEPEGVTYGFTPRR